MRKSRDIEILEQKCQEVNKDISLLKAKHRRGDDKEKIRKLIHKRKTMMRWISELKNLPSK